MPLFRKPIKYEIRSGTGSDRHAVSDKEAWAAMWANAKEIGDFVLVRLTRTGPNERSVEVLERSGSLPVTTSAGSEPTAGQIEAAQEAGNVSNASEHGAQPDIVQESTAPIADTASVDAPPPEPRPFSFLPASTNDGW